MTHAIRPVDFDNLKTMTYEVTDRVARITFNRPEKGNAIIADTPLELSALVERADLDPGVHVILVSGRGEGFCAGFDLSAYAEGSSSAGGGSPYKHTVLSGRTQAINHLPDQPWDPMIDYQMMSRFVRGFSSLLHADKPTVVKIHGYCVAGGTDIALHADQVIAAADAKIGYPPTRVWGVPAAGMWAHRLGDQRAKRLLLTGDCITGAQAAEWGLAVEAPDPAEWCERGYAVVNIDARGAGHSEGKIAHWGDQEAEDIFDTIDWLVRQPWSNGAVVMAGNSWLSISQINFASRLHHPGLKAIAPWESYTDPYRHFIARGGRPHIPSFHKMIAGGFAGPEAYENIFQMLAKRPLYDEYWEAKRIPVENIDGIPVYVLASYSSMLHTYGSFQTFREAKTTRKWLRVHPYQECK